MKHYLDLHTHTTASDGQYSPREVVSKAAEKDIKVLAITDHDTISGLDEALEAGEKEGITVIPGIEISTHKGIEIHVLGFFIDRTNSELVEKCREFEESRANRAIRITEYLNGLGLPVDLDEVRAYAGEGAIGRPHFAKWLLEHGYVKSVKDAFDRFLNTPRFKKETERVKPSPEEAIELIHKAGGVAVLAHPGLMRLGRRNQEEMIEAFAEAGLDGIECLYSKHEKKQEEYYLKLAEKHDLLVTAGSDFHGEKVKPEIALGVKLTPQRLPEKYHGRFMIDIEQL